MAQWLLDSSSCTNTVHIVTWLYIVIDTNCAVDRRCGHYRNTYFTNRLLTYLIACKSRYCYFVVQHLSVVQHSLTINVYSPQSKQWWPIIYCPVVICMCRYFPYCFSKAYSCNKVEDGSLTNFKWVYVCVFYCVCYYCWLLRRSLGIWSGVISTVSLISGYAWYLSLLRTK